MEKKTIAAIVLLISFSFLSSAYFYNLLPDRVASHWNAQGQVDGTMPKGFSLFFTPAVLLILIVFLAVMPRVDPLKKNIEKFRGDYDRFIVLFAAFLVYVHLLTITWNLGYHFEMGAALSPALGVLFYYVGVLVEKSRRNWFIGIRTPWTLSSDNVWKKTHEVGGKLFKISGAIATLGVFFPGYMLYFVLVPVLAVAAYLVVYSYLEYKKENERKKR